MLISTLVLIIVRLFSLSWLMEGLVMMASVPMLHQMDNSRDGFFMFLRFLPSVATLLAAFIGWMIAPKLSRLITGKYDTTVAISGLTLSDLYSFAFVFVGLYFILSSLGNVLYFFYSAFARAAFNNDFLSRQIDNPYQIIRALITAVGGLLCVSYGKKMGKDN
ncbi:MAG TPA: hypothetical protein VGN23_07675 [Verrucomicrobiae bacterium]|jgi:hypothetical protein